MLKKYDPLMGMPTGEYVYDVLRKNIIRMKIKPGEKLSEQELSILLGVSRTPVRESFIKLAKEGVVYILPQRGTYIAKINMRQVEEARFIRRHLEKAVFIESLEKLTKIDILKMEENLAEQKRIINVKGDMTPDYYADFLEMDNSFHKIPYLAADREHTWEFIQSINLNYQRVRTFSLTLEFKLDRTHEEHSKILEYLKKKDPEKLSDILEKHIGNLEFEKDILFKNFPEYFE